MAVLPADIIIDGDGYMVDAASGGGIAVQDLQPGTARATDGEADFISYEAESSHQVSDFSGGAGQARHVNTSSWLTGLGDGSFGHFYPPKLKKDASGNGGTTSFYFRRSGTLYGFTSSNIEQINSSTTFTRTAVNFPVQQPVVTGGGNVFWVDITDRLARWQGSGAAENITPSGFTPSGVAAFGRHLFCFATKPVPDTPSVVQTRFGRASNGRCPVGWATAPQLGNVLIAFVLAENTSDTRTVVPPGGWEEIGSSYVNNVGFAVFISTNTIAKGGGGTAQESASGGGGFGLPFALPGILSGFGGGSGGGSGGGAGGYSEIFTVIGSDGSLDSTAEVMTWMVEVEGIKVDSVLDSIALNSGSATTALSTGTATADAADFSLSFMGYLEAGGASEAIDHAASWTELSEQTSVDGTLRGAVARGTGLSADSDTLSLTADAVVGAVVVLNATEVIANSEQFVVLGSSDDGASWILAPGDFSSLVIGTPMAFLAFDNTLYFTTEYGLYQMRYAEREYSDGTRTLNIAIVQAADFAGVDGTPGKYMVAFEGGVFFFLGNTLYRHTQGGGLESIWPTGSWATVGGAAGAITVAGDSLYFGVGTVPASYLWKFANGRSFHPIASGGDYTHMAWDDGRLYFTADPADYYDFDNPALRPDINDATAANVTTGYLVSSMLDFHKVNLTKLISHFEAQVRYTAASASGTVAWHYLDASSADNDPGVLGGGATSLTWTSIGSHAQGDDSPKVFDLSPIIASKAIYLRATLTPGASGYPYIVYYSPVGRAHPPVQRRFLAPLELKVGTRDKQGSIIYDDEAAVQAALGALQTLRSTPAAFDIIWDDGTSAGETVTVTMTALAIQKVLDRESGQKHLRVVATLDELP